MNTRLLTHIVPTLPPQAGDTGKYALDLARHLRDECGIDSKFILCNPDWNFPTRIEDLVVQRLRFPNEAGLWSLLASMKSRATVLLHYDGYGYHNHGLPTWLYRGIKSWLAELNGASAQCQKQVFTVFHELWGPQAKLWQGRFYRQMQQKHLVARLHRVSQLSITNTRHRQMLLNAIEPQKTLLLPIPSNLPINEPATPRVMRKGPLQVAILSKNAFCETIRAHANLLRALDKTNRLDRAMFLGGSSSFNESLEEVKLMRKYVSPRIEVRGESSPEDISLALNRADLFLSPHTGESACKSGDVMAALAAGCPVILRDAKNSAPLQEGKHFIASDDSPSSLERFERMVAAGELEQIAAAGRLWYQQYADWKVIARRYQEVLQTPAPFRFSQAPPSEMPLFGLPVATARVQVSKPAAIS